MALLLELHHEHNWARVFAAGSVLWPGGGVCTQHGQVSSPWEGRFSSACLHKTGFTMPIPHKPCSLQHWNNPLQSSDQMRMTPGIHTRMLVDPQQKMRKNTAESPGSVTETRNCLCLHLGTFSMSWLNSVLRREGKAASCF